MISSLVKCIDIIIETIMFIFIWCCHYFDAYVKRLLFLAYFTLTDESQLFYDKLLVLIIIFIRM